MVKYRYVAAEDKDEESRASYTVENAAGNELKERGKLSTATYYIDERRGMNTLSLSFPSETDPGPVLELLESTKIPFETDVSGPLVKIRAMLVDRDKLSHVILALSMGKDLEKGRSIPAAIDEKSARAILENEVKEGVPLEQLGLNVRVDRYLTHTGAQQFVLEFPKGNYGPHIQFLREEGMTTAIDTRELRTLPLTRVEFGDASSKDIERFMEAAKKEKYSFEGGRKPEGKDNTVHIYGSLKDVADLMQKSGFFMPDALKGAIEEKMNERQGKEFIVERPTSTHMSDKVQELLAKSRNRTFEQGA